MALSFSPTMRTLFDNKSIVRFVLRQIISTPVVSNCASLVVVHRPISSRCCSQRHSSCLPPKFWGSGEHCFEAVNRKSIQMRMGSAKLHTTAIRRRASSSGSDSDSDNDKIRSSSSIKSSDKTKADDFKSADVDSLLETWFYEVCQYGSLTANIPFNTVIKPLNPQDYPDMNKVIIQLYYDSPTSNSDVPPSHHLSQISELYDLNVTFDEDRANMNIAADSVQGLDIPVSCILHVPLKFGLTVKMSGEKDVSIEKMESDNIDVETDSGDCKLHSIKCGSISVVSQSGNIVCNSTLLGNSILHTGQIGGILMGKIQGSSVSCVTQLGPIAVKSLYSETATFKTVQGNAHLGHCHGQVHFLGVNCHVNIDSLDGDLDIALQDGSVKVLLSRHNRADIDVNTGDIGLSFPEGAATDLNLNCPTLNVHENVGAHFEETDMPHHKSGFISQPGVSQVNARTLSGTISLRLLDWIETTRLAFKTEE